MSNPINHPGGRHFDHEPSPSLAPSDYAEGGIRLAGPNPNDQIKAALNIARTYGGIDGDHHKHWVIDQMVRALTGEHYEAFVREATNADDPKNVWAWSTGVAP